MKKKILCFILFFIIIVITIGGCISNAKNKEDIGEDQSKQLSEIKYLENRIIILLNSLNNITFENYNITISEINEKTEDTSQKSKSESRGNGEDGSTQEESKGSSSQNGGSNEGSSTSNTQDSDKKQYEFNRTGILTKEENVDWENIKNETELIYSVIPTITLDLYQNNIAQEDILNFNKELDNLTQAVNTENREESLKRLANLYSYLPKYARSVTDERNSLIFETKSNIFYAYSLLETGDWNQIQEYTQKGTQTYMRILNNINIGENTNIMNKCYILLNELNNSAALKDKDIFLIKYKNLLEQLNML